MSVTYFFCERFRMICRMSDLICFNTPKKQVVIKLTKYYLMFIQHKLLITYFKGFLIFSR